jgi:hypothetical protein
MLLSVWWGAVEAAAQSGRMPPGGVRGTVTLTFGTPVEVAFDLKADRGKQYRVGSMALTYMGYQALTERTKFVSWPWPLNQLRYRHRVRVDPTWRFDSGLGQRTYTYFRDSANRQLYSRHGPMLAVGGSEVREPWPPANATTLVLRTFPVTTERTYPFEFKEMPVRKPGGEQRPSAL